MSVSRVCLVAVLSLGGVSSAFADRRSQVQTRTLVDAADEALARGDFSDALENIDAAVQIDAGSFGLWYRLAALRSAVGDFDGVVEALTQCMALDPRRADLIEPLEAARAAAAQTPSLDRAEFDSNPDVRAVAADEAAAARSWLLAARAIETLAPSLAPLARAAVARAWGDASAAVEQLRNAYSSDAEGDAALELAAMLAADGDLGAATFFVRQAAASGATPERLQALAQRLGVTIQESER